LEFAKTKKILVVDDNIVNLTQIGELLAGGYEAFLLKSGEQALRFCAKERPDLILLDVEMPGMNGYETIAALKKIPAVENVPVIFLTGNSDEASEIKALESGAMDFLTKPVEKSILLHRIKLHLEMYNYSANLQNTVSELENNVVVCFADLLEYKDANSGGHVLRTSVYVDIIGRELIAAGTFPEELDEDRLKLMVRAAPFHDIGKIGVSDAFLLKPGPLAGAEYDIVKQHTLIGAKVLANIHKRNPSQGYLEYAVRMAEGHHERYGGGGYPRGVSGDEIPLCCRLMSVANVYDACVTDKIYRPALSHREAYDIITRGAGTEFDPRVVDAFARVPRERLAHIERLGET
jgi:putative two-component system response regulator